jgi:histidyl-tRNA synthetase
VHETAGRERAIAGGGRYDKLVELFGGPPTPAVGIAMGDVVIRLVLEDKGLLEPAERYLPRPDVFLILAGKGEAEQRFEAILASLRRADLHVRHSSRATRNVGKLLGEAAKVRARCAVILGDELAQGNVAVKNLDSGEQDDAVPVDGLEDRLKMLVAGG